MFMTTYNFSVFQDTLNISYGDIQYFDSNLYCTAKYTQPYIARISTSGVVTPISTESVFADAIIALAVYGPNTIYCSNVSGLIYKVTNGIASEPIADIGISILSMTLNADRSILYFATSTKIYAMGTLPPTTPVEFTTGFTNLYCIRFYNILYASVQGTTLYRINTDGTIEETINLSKNISGMAIDNGYWYVTNHLSDSGISLLNNISLTDITTNLLTNSESANIVFDSDDYAYYLKTNTGVTSGIYKSSPAFSLNGGTKILCMNNQLKDEYIAIENSK